MSKLEYRAIQELKYKSGQIDRRTFVRSLLATGVALPSALSLAGQVAAATPNAGNVQGHYLPRAEQPGAQDNTAVHRARGQSIVRFAKAGEKGAGNCRYLQRRIGCNERAHPKSRQSGCIFKLL